MTSGMTSMVTLMSDGTAAEVCVVGSEGLVEAFHVLAPGSASSLLTLGFVQVPGTALRMRFAELRKEFLSAEPLRTLVLAYVQSQASLLGQMVACNRLHEVQERLARWLLMIQDQIDEEVLPLTQELLAQMLGTRRSSVTLAASKLQRGGLIEYRRGQLRIVDRESLEVAACECYAVTRKLYADLYK